MREIGTFRWGILGTGRIAAKFAAELPRSRTGRLVASASRSPGTAAAFAALHGGEAVTGYADLLSRDDLDAVYLALPNALHHEWTLRALEAGRHVLCEKPLGLDAVEGREMFEFAAARGLLLMEAFMYRAHPQTRLLFGKVRDGCIGEPRLIRADFTFAREASPGDARFQPGPGGGSIMDVGCYCVDLARALAGTEPDRVESVRHRHELGVDDYAAGLLGFPNGILATFTCGMTVVSEPTAHVAGSEGRLEIPRFWRAEEGFTLVSNGGTVERFEVEEDRPLYAVEADAFAEVVSGAPSWNPPENTLGNLRVLERLRGGA